MGGTMANTHDVSMHSQSSQLSVEKGKDYMLKLLGLKTRDKLKDIMHVLRPLVYIMDPWREESITAIALDKNAQSFYHKIPVELLLTQRSVENILNHNYSQLSGLFHNLSAESSA